jgi:multidrug efflux system outer membrane protein
VRILFSTTTTAALLATASIAVAGLPTIGPDYTRPETPAAAEFRHTEPTHAAWKTAAPADAFTRGDWWKIFDDATLTQLEQDALKSNQDLRASAARVEQAAAAAGLARSAFWPQVALDASANRAQASRTIANQFPQSLANTYDVPLIASWELDLFGRVRRLSESARDQAASTAAVFESVRLSLSAQVAENYFTLRGLDQEHALLRETADLWRRELDLVNARLKNGAATDLDRARAETELASAEAQTAAVSRQRETVQDALAVLVGAPASSFSISENPSNALTLDARVPSVPAGLPSDLLERRPDVAAAERSLASANARIGVAKAAFFPAISLTGSAGFASSEMSHLLQTDSREWSIGPSLYLPIFQGGRNRANLERSKAAFDESVAAYRESVLVAFREVQDALAATAWLNDQAEAQSRALVSAQRAAKLAQARYDAGFVSYLEVIDAERTALATQRVSVQLAAERFTNSVTLIKALGGGWHAGEALEVNGSRITKL